VAGPRGLDRFRGSELRILSRPRCDRVCLHSLRASLMNRRWPAVSILSPVPNCDIASTARQRGANHSSSYGPSRGIAPPPWYALHDKEHDDFRIRTHGREGTRGEAHQGIVVTHTRSLFPSLSHFFPPPPQLMKTISPKSRLATALLAWLLGIFGVHRFYAGNIATGLTMLVLTCTFYGLYITVPWAIIDLIICVC
jgi:hypothetical protein